MMNPGQNPILTRNRDEDDIPAEGNITYQDGRLQPAHLLPQETYTTASQSIIHAREGIDRPLGLPTQGTTGIVGQTGYSEVEPIKARDEKAVLTHLPSVMGSANGGVTTLQNTITTAVTAKDEKAISKNLPSTGIENVSTIQGQTLQSSVPLQGQTLQSSVPLQGHATYSSTPYQGQVLQSSTIHTQPLQSSVLVQGSPYVTQGQSYVTSTPMQGVSSIPVTTTSVYQTTTQQTVPILPAEDAIGTGEIDNHLRDSVNLGRGNESTIQQQSRLDIQQSELHSMRLENHQSFENWEMNRKAFVADRLNIVDDLIAGMERKLQWLDVGVQKTILFFKEREAQELEYSKAVKHDLPQLGDHFQKSEDPTALADLTRGLHESDIFHATEKRNREILGMFIKKDILDWILYPSEKEYKLQADSLRKPTLASRAKLEALAPKRAKAYNKYFKEFDKLQKSVQPVHKNDHLFQRQLKYSLHAREELRMLRLYNEQVLLVIKEFTRLSTSRLGEIQRAFSLYLQKYTELYRNQAATPEPILDIIEHSNGPESVQRIFSVRDLLSPANYEFLCSRIGKPELTYPDVDPFLVHFPESIDPAHSSFVLKEWDAIKQGNLLKKDRACSVIATTNNNLLIVEKKHEEREMGKVKDPLNLRFTKVENVEAGVEGTTLKVVERTPGTLFNHTHRTKLKFETQEEAQQFLQFVNNQTVGDV